MFELSLSQAVAGNAATAPDVQNILSASKLNKVTQLTGFSDPVYAEAYVHVNQYDIVLDVLIVNQTGWINSSTKNLAFLYQNYSLLSMHFRGYFTKLHFGISNLRRLKTRRETATSRVGAARFL